MLRLKGGTIRDYVVSMVDDTILVTGKHEEVLVYKEVNGFGDFIGNAKDLRIGWGQLPDSEVIYIYDKGDDNFCYALNITDGELSEWGYAPFPVEQAA